MLISNTQHALSLLQAHLALETLSPFRLIRRWKRLGDVFHGAFCYSVLQSMPIADALGFSNAMAALNCTAPGARGRIASLDEARDLIARGERKSSPEIAGRAQTH